MAYGFLVSSAQPAWYSFDRASWSTVATASSQALSIAGSQILLDVPSQVTCAMIRAASNHSLEFQPYLRSNAPGSFPPIRPASRYWFHSHLRTVVLIPTAARWSAMKSDDSSPFE